MDIIETFLSILLWLDTENVQYFFISLRSFRNTKKYKDEEEEEITQLNLFSTICSIVGETFLQVCASAKHNNKWLNKT